MNNRRVSPFCNNGLPAPFSHIGTEMTRRPGALPNAKSRPRRSGSSTIKAEAVSEVDLDPAVEESADIAVDRAAPAGAGEAIGRKLVEEVVDAQIEPEATAHLRLQPHVVIEDLRITDRRGRIRVGRRISLDGVGGRVTEDRHRADVAHRVVDAERTRLISGLETRREDRIAEIAELPAEELRVL